SVAAMSPKFRRIPPGSVSFPSAMSFPPVRIALGLVLALASAWPALALAPRSREELDRRVIPAPTVLPAPEAAEDGKPGPAAAPAAASRRRHGGKWSLTFDRRTGRLATLEGEGIPLFPGRGNGLTASQAGLAKAAQKLADIEPLGRAFLDAEGELLK